MRRTTAGLLLCFASAACNGRDGQRAPDDAGPPPAGAAPASAGSDAALSPDDPWVTWAPPSPGAPRPPCEATGHWSPCGIMLRLDRAGVAPRVTAGEVHEEPLRQSGRLVRLGSAELLVFLYPDSAARAADEARLDPKRYIDAYASPTLRGEATLIRSDNLLAILKSRSEAQRERVALAITAGPVQPHP